MAGLLYIALFWALPVYVSAKLCGDRNRDPWKGAFLAFFLGWFAVIGLWMALRTRDAHTRMLY